MLLPLEENTIDIIEEAETELAITKEVLSPKTTARVMIIEEEEPPQIKKTLLKDIS